MIPKPMNPIFCFMLCPPRLLLSQYAAVSYQDKNLILNGHLCFLAKVYLDFPEEMINLTQNSCCGGKAVFHGET